MKKGLKGKVQNQKGFTLVEMLIVVAIIAILVAVSIPLITNALDQAKHATDAANERAAKAEILIQWLSDGGTSITAGTTYYYDAVKGSVEPNTTATIASYGKHTGHDDKIIAVQVTTGGEVYIGWVDEKTSGKTISASDTTLCSVNTVTH